MRSIESNFPPSLGSLLLFTAVGTLTWWAAGGWWLMFAPVVLGTVLLGCLLYWASDR